MFAGRTHADLHHGHFIEASERGAASERGPACEIIETKNPRYEIQSDSLDTVKAVKAVKARKLKSLSTTKSLTSRCTTTIVSSKARKVRLGMG